MHPGHGRSAPVGVQAGEQREYLRTVRGLVRTAVTAGSPGGSEVTADEQASVIAEIERRFPAHPPVAKLPLPQLYQANVSAVAREVAAEDPAALPTACRP